MHLASEIRCKDTWHKHTLKKAFTHWVISNHYNDVIMSAMASQITSLTIVYSSVYSGADQRKHQSSAPLAFVWGTHRGPVNSPHKGPVTRKMFPFDDVILCVGKTGHYWFRWPFRPFYLHVLTSTPSGISNHMLGKAWDEIIYPFPDIISSWQDSGCISFSKTHSRGLNQLHFAIFKSKTFVTGKPWT